MNASVEAVNVDSSEFLTFTLGAEEYGVDILKVQEIRRYNTVTRIPDTPDFIKGVVNLRGTIVPVIDLRQKLKFERADYDAFTVMIILNTAKRVVGMVVDSVRSEARRVGTECVSTFRSRWSAHHSKKNVEHIPPSENP